MAKKKKNTRGQISEKYISRFYEKKISLLLRVIKFSKEFDIQIFIALIDINDELSILSSKISSDYFVKKYLGFPIIAKENFTPEQFIKYAKSKSCKEIEEEQENNFLKPSNKEEEFLITKPSQNYTTISKNTREQRNTQFSTTDEQKTCDFDFSIKKFNTIFPSEAPSQIPATQSEFSEIPQKISIGDQFMDENFNKNDTISENNSVYDCNRYIPDNPKLNPQLNTDFNTELNQNKEEGMSNHSFEFITKNDDVFF